MQDSSRRGRVCDRNDWNTLFMKDPLTLLRNLRQQIGMAGDVLYFKDTEAAHNIVVEIDRTIGLVYAHPWSEVEDGIYLCYIENRDPRPVEIFTGEGEFWDQKLFRWVQGAKPGRLLHEMPQMAELIPAPQMGIPPLRGGQD